MTTGPVLASPTAPSPLLSQHTTLHVGGPARAIVRATTTLDLIAAVRQADQTDQPVLIVGGGSNLLVSDDGFPGLVVLVETTGITVESPAAGGDEVLVTVAAGEVWDDLVAMATERGWAGLECLSGIPGRVGAAPVQNIGAYGAEVAAVIETVRVWDRRDDHEATLRARDCDFGYRTSRFKADPGRYLIVEVRLRLRRSSSCDPLAYPELARRLGLTRGDVATIGEVRQAVLDLRRGKAMVVDPADHDTWSAGSFFTNPVLDEAAADALPDEAPRFPDGTGRVKTSAAWLIEHAGFPKGYGDGPARLSTRHVLALTNRGSATAADIIALARRVADGVEARFGVRLVPEPVFVGCSF
ncbi:MAG: UDP-N-acetylmuramate dehydrogenase [Propionibacteriaceae bacterium]|jgi:UDP-N-acetylmuramate dehydrogenase|nr:UDP-N-acetylmuramate dehydrogenase [Propionibacteriaceae bacterium]